MSRLSTVICPRCNCENCFQTGNPELFRCPDCHKEFKLVEVISYEKVEVKSNE